MASDYPLQKIQIKDLDTKSVILYPSRAHVTRDINDVILKSGMNEVQILGLSPSVDEQSIQIDGKGAASIVDMTVDLVPNHDIFDEAFPQEDDESESDDDTPYEDSDDEDEAYRSISAELKSLKLELEEQTEAKRSANERLQVLNNYSKTCHPDKTEPEVFDQILEKYEKESKRLFEQHRDATINVDRLKKAMARKEYEADVAGKAARKRREKLAKKKEKERTKKERRRDEKRKEKEHVRAENIKFWPKKVYKITLLLETAYLDTPSSSRRNSLDSVTLAKSTQNIDTLPKGNGSAQGGDTLISLSLSYVTRDANWCPKYDLQIKSQAKSASIIYRTEFTNFTSETWRNAKLSFSTSQTSYQGLEDNVPFMHPWHVKLSKGYREDSGLLSNEEASQPRYVSSHNNLWGQKKRSDMYETNKSLERSSVQTKSRSRKMGSNNVQRPAGSSLFGQPQLPTGGGLFGSALPQSASLAPAAEGRGGFGSFSNAITQSYVSVPEPASHAPPPPPGGALFGSAVPSADEMSYDLEADESVEFEESNWEDSGLTATYEVPGVRTLQPSSQKRQHKIITLKASTVELSYILVPKLKAAAFLRAKIRNPSNSITLLKGSVGVTLDNTFLGNMTLPRVSPNQLFTLGLGNDSSIHVTYPKPTVKRSTQGLFNKESAHLFERSIWINNTKTVPVELLVLDQIPVSEDEKLRLEIVSPAGLKSSGSGVRTGISAKEAVAGGILGTASKGQNWGSAKATLKKAGEIAWEVKIEKSQGCLLKFEYEARMPANESIYQSN